MDVGFQKITQRIINHSVPLHAVGVRETVGNDVNIEMPFTIPCPGVSFMQVTLVLDPQLLRPERLYQPLPDQVLALCTHGRTGLNGFTLTDSYTPAST